VIKTVRLRGYCVAVLPLIGAEKYRRREPSDYHHYQHAWLLQPPT